MIRLPKMNTKLKKINDLLGFLNILVVDLLVTFMQYPPNSHLSIFPSIRASFGFISIRYYCIARIKHCKHLKPIIHQFFAKNRSLKFDKTPLM